MYIQNMYSNTEYMSRFASIYEHKNENIPSRRVSTRNLGIFIYILAPQRSFLRQ